MEDLKIGDVLLAITGGARGFGAWKDYRWKETRIKKVNQKTYTLENGDIVYKNRAGEKYFRSRGETQFLYALYSIEIIKEMNQSNLDQVYENFNRDIKHTDKSRLKYCLERKLKEISEEDGRDV